MTAAARYASKPRPGAVHEADRIARLAAVLGGRLMPWQYQVLRTATERHPLDLARYRFRHIVISVPRQAGKTRVIGSKNVYRTISRPNHAAFYTAQTGKDARERWTDLRKIVEDSPLSRFVVKGNPYGGSIALGAGHSAITWPNGSTIRPFAPTASSLHGYTPPDVDRDEVWDYDELTGEALDGAIGPAQITLPHAQRWDLSTMGDADSTYWHRIVDNGRASVDDPDSTTAYFEWSADPDSDLYSPENWASFHPAVGHTIDVRDLAAAAQESSAGTWQRAFCNLRTQTREAVVDLVQFARLGDPDLRIVGKGSSLAYDVAHDQSQATISLGRQHGEDAVAVRVIRSAMGVDWVADAVVELADRWGITTVHADDNGPARDVSDELRRRGRNVEALNGRDYATGCGAWLRRTRDGRLAHDRSAVLLDAMGAAAIRPLGDAQAFSRRHSSGPIDALVACVVAARAALLAPIPEPEPMIRMG